MNKLTKRMTAAFLTVLLIISVLPASVFAVQGSTPKEEVVYISLNGDGSVKEIEVVNIFDLDQKGNIVDYGKYESLRNMTTEDSIEYKNDTVKIDADAGKLYYEGKLKQNIMPWRINIRYFIDGKEYSAEELAGMSGRLDIKMTIRQNPDCDSSFFDGYALQATIVLDTDNASGIMAGGATIANAGSDKQLTYTVLPGREKDIDISADVKDFEMKGIAINGIRMNLDIDIEDTQLQKKIDEVIGVNELDDGVGELQDGAFRLYDGAGALDEAAGKLQTATQSLYDGATELKSGLAALTSQNSELTGAAWSAYEALCSAAQEQLNTKLDEAGLAKVTLTPDTYSQVLMNILDQMDAETVYNKAYNAALAEVTAKVEAQADTLYSEYIRSQADSIYLAYITSQSDSLYKQVASEAVMKQLQENGYTKAQAAAYLGTDEGQLLVDNAVAATTDSQKEQILQTAAYNLTDSQKKQILQGAISSLTDEDKSEIRNSYIMQLMAGDEVTSQINKAVKSVNASAAEVSELKGQLDSYGAFYKGLVNYTDAVSSAAVGASVLADGLSELYSGTDKLKEAVGELHIATGRLKDGIAELKEGTKEFANEADEMNTKVSDEIDSLTDSITGADTDVISFASKQNTKVRSVQFVIKTEDICTDDAVDTLEDKTEELTFWQKLVQLFKK